MSVLAARIPMWTPWTWLSMTLFLAVAFGLVLVVVGIVRKSAGWAAIGIALALLAAMLHFVAIELAAEREQRRRSTSQPATSPSARLLRAESPERAAASGFAAIRTARTPTRPHTPRPRHPRRPVGLTAAPALGLMAAP